MRILVLSIAYVFMLILVYYLNENSFRINFFVAEGLFTLWYATVVLVYSALLASGGLNKDIENESNN